MYWNLVFPAHKRHIGFDYYFVRGKVIVGSIITHYLSSYLEIADVLTKQLPQQSFFAFKFELDIHLVPRLSLRKVDEETKRKF